MKIKANNNIISDKVLKAESLMKNYKDTLLALSIQKLVEAFPKCGKAELSKAKKIVQAEQVLVANGYDTNDHQEDDDEAEEEESEAEEEDPVVSKKKKKAKHHHNESDVLSSCADISGRNVFDHNIIARENNVYLITRKIHCTVNVNFESSKGGRLIYTFETDTVLSSDHTCMTNLLKVDPEHKDMQWFKKKVYPITIDFTLPDGTEKDKEKIEYIKDDKYHIWKFPRRNILMDTKFKMITE
ncbi:hypothetical protein PPL_06293 [Heterostelium album PN500]|uniref:Uncharacterized protein n=1 Tax=Heterostelium pallidum (strain ATCC 26659 / Pp 5 / PN500) TaxID=670386 RepID=D3BCR5_HETP5|nr:hypothetical protein PPL_06293 [Heterostelium album PN500]EFA80707.1 hypothetical protein PPL_06293 [Heterostelium album PN500]|eukprot:XP_020432827.1 hypothetical protein PPL_06293 [Heterostelium album PN500]